MKKLILVLLLSLFLSQSSLISGLTFMPVTVSEQLLSSRQFSMEYRYPVASVSKTFKENILLNLAYLDGRVTNSQDINWDVVNSPFHTQFTLQPNQTFAFHDNLLPEFKNSVVLTTNAHFNKQDGFKSDGYLFGDGVCQLASFINMAAREANLEVKAPTNHNFAAIPEVPKKYGVAIYFDPNNTHASALENLYVTNNQSKPVVFHFDYQDGQLKISISKIS